MNRARGNGGQETRNKAGSARIARLASAAALLGLCSGFAMAAGGHHAVDDAAILDEGACKVESWIARGGGERLLHAGTGCRVGPLELSAGADYARADGSSATGYGLAGQMGHRARAGVSVGVVLAPGWQAHVRPRYQGRTVLALATWAPRDDLSLHLNVGRDFLHAAADESRYGVAAEWTPRSGLVAGRRTVPRRADPLRACRCPLVVPARLERGPEPRPAPERPRRVRLDAGRDLGVPAVRPARRPSRIASPTHRRRRHRRRSRGADLQETLSTPMTHLSPPRGCLPHSLPMLGRVRLPAQRPARAGSRP